MRISWPTKKLGEILLKFKNKNAKVKIKIGDEEDF